MQVIPRDTCITQLSCWVFRIKKKLTKIPKNVFYNLERNEMIRVQFASNVCIIEIREWTELKSTQADELVRQISAQYMRNNRKIIVNLKLVTCANASAVLILINRLNATMSGLKLCFCCLQTEVQRCFEENHFLKIFRVCETEKEAIESFDR